ncbi:MAG: TetR/AcrR family transcriptional regulator [Henriciella sp.]|nr:TetR/AcrR family transcriptional regulator [Henriciella sp.]
MTKTSTLPPRLRQPERRNLSERRLIEAALSLAAEQGVQAVTMEAIGKRAGYSRGLASQRFGSKAGLIRAVINHLHNAQQAEIESPQFEGMNGLDTLIQFVGIHIQALKDSPETHAYFMFFASGVADRSAIRNLFAESHERVKHKITDILLGGQSDGSIRSQIDAEAAALMVGSLILGVSVQWLTDPGLDLQRVTTETQDLLRASFKSPDLEEKADD